MRCCDIVDPNSGVVRFSVRPDTPFRLDLTARALRRRSYCCITVGIHLTRSRNGS